MFVGAVAAGRGVSAAKVLANFGQGRMVLAQDAVAAGMADRVATLDQVLSAYAAVEAPSTDDFTTVNPTSEIAMKPNTEVRAAKQTKRVANEDLPKANFAYQGSDALADWKLPIKFSTHEKTVTHIENAISQWPKTDMPNATEKAKARSRIKAAARENGVTLSSGDLAKLAYREVRAAGDNDLPYDYCTCDCSGCTAGNCHACESDDCKDVNCECCGFEPWNLALATGTNKATPEFDPSENDEPSSFPNCKCACAPCQTGNCKACELGAIDCPDDNDNDDNATAVAAFEFRKRQLMLASLL
jgi:hypothetical protein